ncbi:MAG: hypothetical protein ACN4GM_10935 [Gammaproteobacteria bacterium]
MIHLYAIGSPIEQDNLAWLLVEKLQPQLTAQFPELYIEYFDRPGMQLVNELSDKNRVLLVDTLLSEKSGDIQLLQAEELQLQTSSFSSHGFGVAEALQLSQQLNLLPETLWILGIPADSQAPIDNHTIQQLSEQLLHKLQNIMNHIATDNLQ